MDSKIIRVAALFLLSLFFSTGCWDRQEVENQAYVVAIGMDVVPGDPAGRIITFQLVIPAKLGVGGQGGGGSGEKSYFQTSVKASSIYEARDLLQASVSRQISLLQCRAVLFSDELARRSILSGVRVAERSQELRRSLFFAIIDGTAQEFLQKNQPLLNVNITKYYEEIAQANKYTGYSTTSSFQSTIEGVESSGEAAVVTYAGLGNNLLDAPLTKSETGKIRADGSDLPRQGGTKGNWIGVAVFKGDKMVGKLDKLEAETLNMLRGDFESGPFEVQDPMQPKYLNGVNLRQVGKPQIRVDLSSDPVRLDVRMEFEGNLMSEFGGTDYTVLENRDKLERAAQKEIEEQTAEVITKAQELKTDIFSFGNSAVKKHFWTWQEWEKFNWPEKFSKADIRVSARVKIRFFGLQNGPSQTAH